MNKSFLILVISFLCLIQTSQGQSFYNYHFQPKHSASIGIGPSFIYADNGGRLSNLDFAVRPTINLIYLYSLNDFISLRATLGAQLLQSNTQVDRATKERWGERNQAFAFQGRAFYFDATPIIHLFPQHYNPNQYNFYGGIGVGIMHVYRTQETMIFDQARSEDAFTQTAYIPVRAGITRALDRDWKVSLEGGFMYTFSDELDGNVGYNSHGNDHLFQFQVILTRSFF